MEAQIKSVLSSSPWLTSFQVCAALGKTDEVDRVIVRGEIKELLSSGEAIKAGRGKGTRYALAGTPPQEQAAAPDHDAAFRTIVLFVEKNLGCQFADIAKALELDSSIARPIVNAALADKVLVKRGKARWTKYYLPGLAPAEESKANPVEQKKQKPPPRTRAALRRAVAANKSQAPSSKALEVPQLEAEESEAPKPAAPKLSLVEACANVCLGMKPGKRIEPILLAKRVHDRYPHIQQYDANTRIIEMIRADELFHEHKNINGHRLVCWLPSPGEENPNDERDG